MFERVTGSEMKPRDSHETCYQIFSTCENGWSNFTASQSRVIKIAGVNSIRMHSQIYQLTVISYVPFFEMTSSRVLVFLRCHLAVIIPQCTYQSGRGARVSACAGLINQLQRCRFDCRIAGMENPDTAIVGDWWTGAGGHHALYC